MYVIRQKSSWFAALSWKGAVKHACSILSTHCGRCTRFDCRNGVIKNFEEITETSQYMHHRNQKKNPLIQTQLVLPCRPCEEAIVSLKKRQRCRVRISLLCFHSLPSITSRYDLSTKLLQTATTIRGRELGMLCQTSSVMECWSKHGRLARHFSPR